MGCSSMIHHSRPSIDEDDIAAVDRVLRSGWLAPGEQVRRFEAEVSSFVGHRFGLASSSGAAALHLALLSLGVGRGDEVLIPAYACAAVMNAVEQTGAAPVLCDVDPETANLLPEEVARRLGARARAVIVVHSFGHPADLDWVKDSPVPVIEDCAQALGARWRGRPVGARGALAVFSFYATKVITTGMGGMVCTSDPELAERLRSLRGCDKRDTHEVRWNCRMSDLAAGLGRSQFARLPELLRRRRALADEYDRRLAGLAAALPPRRRDGRPIFYRYVIRVPRADRVIAAFAARGVECKRPVYRPLHRYQGEQFLPHADRFHEQAVSLPLYPSLTREEVDHLLQAAREALGAARRTRARVAA